MDFLKVLFCLVVYSEVSNSANILFYFGVSTYSHRIIVWPLVEKLVERGHNVTFLSPYPAKSPNPKVHEICREELTNAMKHRPGQLNEATLVHLRIKNLHGQVWDKLHETGYRFCKAVTESPELVDWVKTSQYDLVIIDALYNECALGLAFKFNAPHISFGTSSVFMWMYDMFGFPAETSWVPDLGVNFPRDMSFLQKMSNTLRPLYWHFMRHWVMFPKVEDMLRETFEMPNMPPLKSLERQASLVLLNSHYSLDYARSLPPLVVPVGGMQCKNSTTELPQNIQDFISAGDEEGFIYVSFGSNVQFSKIPEHIQRLFFEAFGNSTVRFIMKSETTVLGKIPDNVFMGKWMPQQDLLAHPKIRAFISHSGLLSTQEATFHGVPIIAFPLFAEQDYNAELIANEGIGIRLEMAEITLQKLKSAIAVILSDNRYKDKMMETSKVFRDRPSTPLDTAVWWTEFVLRNKNTSSFLLPLGAQQTWYQRRGLDVWGIILILVMMALTLISLFSYKLLRYILQKWSTIDLFRSAIATKEKDI